MCWCWTIRLLGTSRISTRLRRSIKWWKVPQVIWSVRRGVLIMYNLSLVITTTQQHQPNHHTDPCSILPPNVNPRIKTCCAPQWFYYPQRRLYSKPTSRACSYKSECTRVICVTSKRLAECNEGTGGGVSYVVMIKICIHFKTLLYKASETRWKRHLHCHHFVPVYSVSFRQGI